MWPCPGGLYISRSFWCTLRVPVSVMLAELASASYWAEQHKTTSCKRWVNNIEKSIAIFVSMIMYVQSEHTAKNVHTSLLQVLWLIKMACERTPRAMMGPVRIYWRYSDLCIFFFCSLPGRPRPGSSEGMSATDMVALVGLLCLEGGSRRCGVFWSVLGSDRICPSHREAQKASWRSW